MTHFFKRMLGQNRGAVYVEFLIVVIPFLLMFFGLTQLGLLYGAHLLVSHAAAKAVRAAIVILPDEYGDYDDVPINTIGTSGEGLDAYMDTPEKGRLEAIRKAARYTLSPISPSLETTVSSATSLAEAIGDHPGLATVVGALGWTRYATAVTFPNDADGYISQFPAQGYITARVTFLYKCSVPIIRGLVCHRYDDLPENAQKELDTVGVSTIVGTGSRYLGWRFAVLSAERTMPNQGR